MSLVSVVWANALRDISPLAKLVAIDLAHVSGYEEIGARSLEDLADFSCCNLKDVEAALIELSPLLRIEKDGEKVRAIFPTREDEQKTRERSQRQKEYKENRCYHLYVIGKGGKVKIGISRQLERRLSALRMSFPIETEVLLTASGPYRAIRRAESRAHEVLKDCALGGEYFDVAQARAVEVAKLALADHGVTPSA